MMRRPFILLGFMVIILSNPIAAQNLGAFFGSNWISAAGAAVLVSYALVAVGMMIGVGFHYLELIEWSKREFWEATLSAAMIGLVFAFLTFATDTSNILAGKDFFAVASDYLSEARGRLSTLWLQLLMANMNYGILATTNVGFFIPIPIPPAIPSLAVIRTGGTGIAPFAGLSPLLLGLSLLFNAVNMGLMAVWAQKVILNFAQQSGLSVFLPLGILLRATPLTRKIGGTLIALALTLYFVYPLALAFSGYLMFLAPVDEASLLMQVAQFTPSIGVLTIIAEMALGITAKALIDVLRPALQLAVGVGVTGFITLIITITGFRSLAFAVGGDPRIFGLRKAGL